MNVRRLALSTDIDHNSFPSLLLRAWSGSLPLWQIFWLGLVLGTIAIAGLIRFVIIKVLVSLSIKNSVLLFFCLALPVLILLWVAVWRSASHSSFVASIAARAVVALHAGWYIFKFALYLTIYGSLTYVGPS